MIFFEEALAITRERTGQLLSEATDFRDSCGRVLAADLASDVDMPPFDKSSMDGFACRSVDLDKPLDVIATIAAGSAATGAVTEGTCMRIMTGAMVPPGADVVIKVEETEMVDGKVRFTGRTGKSNICYRAEDVARGQVVLSKGTLLSERHLPMLAAIGAHHPEVYRRPRAGIISTGTELVEPWEIPGPGQIRNTNGHQLIAQAQSSGTIATYHGIVDDTKDDTIRVIREAMEVNDIILLSGGVSKGDFDLVPGMLVEAGMEIHFREIAIQPGKPTLFATGRGKYCFALPGNPVSSFVLFETLVRPFLWLMQGHEYHPDILRAPMGTGYTRKKTSRLAYIPVRIRDQHVHPVEYHGSAHIHALSDASGLISLETGKAELKEGELVDVRLL